MYIIRCMSFVLFLLLLAACSTDTDSKENVQEEETEKITSIAQQSNELGFSMLERVERDELGNAFLSPLSSFIALIIVNEGADGDTKKEIETLLSLNDISEDERREAVSATLDMLERDLDDLTVKTANSLWLNDQYHFKSSFEDIMNAHYDAEINDISMRDESSVKRINDWVRQATKDKITKMIEGPLDDETVLFILQTVYFNGTWKHAFTADTNEERTFYTGKEDVTIPFMMLEEELYYEETPDYEAVKIPYAHGEMSMYVILPNDDAMRDEVISNWANRSWDDIENSLTKKQGTVILPQFQLEYEVNLEDVLTELGMERAFIKDMAQFPHFIEEDVPLWIDEIKQKTYVEVDETGTEAAGATSVEITTLSAPLEEDTFFMEVSRPFFMMITDETTKTHLFVGDIVHPEQKENSPS